MSARYVVSYAEWGAAVLDLATARFAGFNDPSTADEAVRLLNDESASELTLFWEPLVDLFGAA